MRVPMRVLEIKRGMFWGIFFKWRVREKDPSKVMKQLITWWLRGGSEDFQGWGSSWVSGPLKGAEGQMWAREAQLDGAPGKNVHFLPIT